MELALRASGESGLVLHTEDGARQQPGEPPFRFVLRPNARVEITYANRGGETVRKAIMSINGEGMRGRLPGEGRPRIACIGDSHTFGFGVGDDEPWPAALEAELRSHRSTETAAARAEVLNFGVGGYGPAQEIERLLRDALPLSPDIVLWQWFFNDAKPKRKRRPPRTFDRRVEPWVHPSRPGWIRQVRQRSVLADLTLHRIYQWCQSRSHSIEDLASKGQATAQWQEILETLRRARRLSEASGARFAIVVHPLMVAQGSEFASAPVDSLVVEFCAQEKLPCIDLSKHLSPSECSVLRNSLLDYHASATCHALSARAIAETLRRWGWVD